MFNRRAAAGPDPRTAILIWNRAMFREVTIGPCRLINADCMDVLPTLEKVDAVVTDPPYGIKRSGQQETFTKSSKHKRKHHANLGWDEERPSKKVFDAIRDISVEQIIWGGNYFADMLPPSMGWLYWNKGQDGLSMSDGELAWTSMQKALRAYTCNRSALIGSVHPTQKPLRLMLWCLQQVDTASVIADPYMGSGTTGIACIQLDRGFIGIEKEPKYFDIACDRIQRAWDLKCSELPFEKPEPLRQVEMFDPHN